MLPLLLLAVGIPAPAGFARAFKGMAMALSPVLCPFLGCPAFPHPSAAAPLLGISDEFLPTCTAQPSTAHPMRMLRSCTAGSE